MPTAVEFQTRPAHKPLYGQVRDLIHARIASGVWKDGHTIPNELRLASEFGVSIGTVRRAMEGLERAGVIARKQGRGSFVRGKVETSANASFRARPANGAEPGDLTHIVADVSRRKAVAKERALLADSSAIVEFSIRLNFQSRTVGQELALVPASLIDAVLPDCHVLVDREVGGVARMLLDFGVRLQRLEDVLSVVPASPATATAIEAGASEPTLHCRRILFAQGERPVAVVIGHYLASQVVYVGRNCDCFA